MHDLLAAEAKLFGDSASPNDVNEIINYVGAMKHGLERPSELPVSVRLIREIHEKRLQVVRSCQHPYGETH